MKTKQRGVCPRFLFGFGLLIVLFNIFMALFLHERSWDMHTGILMTPHAVKSTSSIKSHVVYWVQEPGIVVTGFPSPSTSPRSYRLPAGSLAVAETGDSDSTLRQLVFPVVGSVPASLLTEVASNRTVSASCAPSSFRTHVAFVDSKSAATATATTTTAVDCCSACVQQKGCNSWSFVGASDCRLMHFSEIPSQQPPTKTSRGTTSGSLQDWFIVVSPPSAALDPFLLRLREPSDTWTGQWPIGSGSMGALVGGSSTSEVIPLSISGLYVTEKNALGAKAPVDATVKIAPRSKLDAFKSAREALKRGNVTGALHDLAQLEDSGLGMFEYAGDLVLRFSDVPLRPVDQQDSQHNARAQQRPKRKGLGPLYQQQPQSAERAPGFMPSSSRRGVITRLEELFEPAPLKRSAEAYESRLDTRLGVATSVFIGLASGNQPVRGHQGVVRLVCGPSARRGCALLVLPARRAGDGTVLERRTATRETELGCRHGHACTYPEVRYRALRPPPVCAACRGTDADPRLGLLHRPRNTGVYNAAAAECARVCSRHLQQLEQ
jgi:PAN domain